MEHTTAGRQQSRRTAVVQGKLRPPEAPDRLVERSRLDLMVARLLERFRVLIVSATAGAGKSTAVAEAVRPLSRPVAWLTLDSPDTAPGRLATYLEAALAKQLPRLDGVATTALASGVPHTEAIAMLAEAVEHDPMVLVLDELERLGDHPEPWALIEALARYAPAQMRIILISRRQMPATLSRLVAEGRAASLGETDLAFTREEASTALASLGTADIDAAGAVEATGGWVTGVLFEVWRSQEHVPGMGGEADPLYGYLSSHILGQLPSDDREFLITTSVLRLITAERAEALGVSRARERLASLRVAHLPAVWEPGGGMRCHSRLREYLGELLQRRGTEDVRAVRRAHGRLLAEEALYEEATEEQLRAGALDEALACAERAILRVVERLDLAIARRWLRELEPVRADVASPLVEAELMMAITHDEYRRAVAVADRLGLEERRRLARTSSRAAALMTWCYGHLERWEDARALLEVAAPGPEIEAQLYAHALEDPGPSPERPELTGGPLDALVLTCDYGYGRLRALAEEGAGRWVDTVAGPWRIAALRAIGRTERALELIEAARERGLATLALEVPATADTMIDAGRREDALEAIERAIRVARANGASAFEELAHLAHAKLALRLDRDPDAALNVLDAIDRGRGAWINEQADTWYGYARLLRDEVPEALARLRSATASMREGERLLELPTASVYLSEAEWRGGDEEAADRAADLALEAARRQGSNHLLLQALADFPAVVSRRLDAVSGTDSQWHGLGRALAAQGVPIAAHTRTRAELHEFGRARLVVDGEEPHIGLVKSLELLAFFAARRGAPAQRTELLDALFEGRTDDSARAYLRQSIQTARRWLGSRDALVLEDRTVRLGDGVSVESESAVSEARLAEVARMHGEDRLALTLDALALHDRGVYLPDARSSWTDERRSHLDELASDARQAAAEIGLAAGRVQDAQRLVEEVLRADRFREGAWRLAMRLAGAMGHEDGVISAFHRCEEALAEIGTTPAHATRQLLDHLRR